MDNSKDCLVFDTYAEAKAANDKIFANLGKITEIKAGKEVNPPITNSWAIVKERTETDGKYFISKPLDDKYIKDVVIKGVEKYSNSWISIGE